ncbi:MAG: HAMP domain-containing histidine kinase [Candidatus Cloacimonetes bacterium]|nr:HAMP domain-containing histidine kinase [Candidatus Cloacimonadota bacterium]
MKRKKITKFNTHRIFQKEMDILKNSNEVLKRNNISKKDLLIEFKVLKEHFEKLLSVSRKITKLSDIYERRLLKAKEQIENQKEELSLHQEHLELINTILRHDITNNLAVIKSALRIYSDLKDENLLKEASKSIDKSVSLIRNMRDLEQFMSTCKDLRLYDTREILGNVIKNYKDIEIDINGKCIILADEALSSVFDNLLRNAIIHGKANKINIFIAKKNNNCEIKIADNGIGIPDKIKENLFDEGFKYGKKGHTGLGLYIVSKAMESYGGSVSIEDNHPKGTVFTLKFRRVG